MKLLWFFADFMRFLGIVPEMADLRAEAIKSAFPYATYTIIFSACM